MSYLKHPSRGERGPDCACRARIQDPASLLGFFTRAMRALLISGLVPSGTGSQSIPLN